MRTTILACAVLIFTSSSASAARLFAVITKVDAEKGTIEYTITFGKDKDDHVKGKLGKDCVIKEGYYRLGKPATTNEGDDIAEGLKNKLFRKASAENPLQVNIFTADKDDKDQGIVAGDVIKILVNPKMK